jgi:hypothetical protein
MGGAFTIRQPTPGQLYGVFDTGVDLILHTPVTGPATSHGSLLLQNITQTESSEFAC